MERETIPLLAKFAQTENQAIAVRDESAEDDAMFQTMLVGPIVDSQAETKLTRVLRETTDDN